MVFGVFTPNLPAAVGLTFLLAAGCAPASTQSTAGATPEPPREDSVVVEQPARTPAPASDDQQDERPGVAVWPFSNGGSFGTDPWDYTALEVGLQQMLITELAQNSELRLINRSHLREIIDELDLAETGYVSPETTAEAGRLVGARYMIIGSFIDANGTMRLDARVDNVETGEILVETAAKVEDERDDLLAMVVELGAKIVDSADLPSLPQEVLDARRSIDFPGEEAGMLYSQAVLQDTLGNRNEAVRILRRVVTEFPEYDGAREMLEQYEEAPS